MSLGQVVSLSKRFDSTAALDRVSLEIDKGDILVLLGPSGCGKTTLLRSIAGLVRPDSGEILLEGQVVFSAERGIFVPPHIRRVGMVFQNYALWPHMNIFDNIAYPLKIGKFSKQEIQRRVGEMMTLVKLEGLAKRYPHELSGGQQQRAALSRALVMDPRLLLLDEPLSSLDAKLREEMREEVKKVQAGTQVTMLYVTHDQAEAMALADRIGVMKDGRLLQLGPPSDIYERPETEFVAQFIGASNLLFGTMVKADGQRLFQLGSAVAIPFPSTSFFPLGQLVLAIRPEDIIVTTNGSGAPATIESATYLGNSIEYRLRVGEQEIRARTAADQKHEAGERVFIQARQGMPVGRPCRKKRMGRRWRRSTPTE